jgi:hypothetical protein
MRDVNTDQAVDTYPDCTAVRATAKAVLVRIPALNGEFWVPQRVIHDDSEVYGAGHVGRLVILEWFGMRLLEERESRRKAVAS